VRPGRRRSLSCRIAHGVLTILAAPALAACSAGTARIPPLPPTPHPALGGPAIAQIRGAGVLRVASDLSYPPMEFRENGAPRGFEVDLAALLAGALGVRLEIIDVPLTVTGAEFPAGVDVLLSGIPAEGAAAVGRPSEPYYVSSQAILWRDGAPVRTPQDLRGLRVAVSAGSPGEALAAGAGAFAVSYLPEQAMADVAAGRAQAAVGDRPLLLWYAQTHPHLHVSAGAWHETALVAVTRWDASDLAAFITAALRELRANGGLDQLRRRWHL
jgi:polar amino acid transport system substrate-binding protein